MSFQTCMTKGELPYLSESTDTLSNITLLQQVKVVKTEVNYIY